MVSRGGLIEMLRPARGNVLFLDREGYRKGETLRLMDHMRRLGYQVARQPLPGSYDSAVTQIPQFPRQPLAVVRWEEHGELFNNADWHRTVRHLYAQGIAPISVDYGYFDHRNTLLLDVYLPDGRRTIDYDWPALTDADPWPTADPRLIAYRDGLLAEKARALDDAPLVPGQYGVIWLQTSHYLARPPFATRHMVDWIRKAAAMLEREGLKPVLKATPITNVMLPPDIEAFGKKGNWDRVLNVRLAVHAAANVILCSSVSNELVILGAPVTALGRSLFNGLGVFHEPSSWSDPVALARDIDHGARNRWCAWWLSRQRYAEDIV